MSGGCTSCGQKGGCDSRKHEMMAAIEEALARLYPTRRWSERDDEAAASAPTAAEHASALEDDLQRVLRTAVFFRRGDEDELCDYLYVLCVGREPCLAAWLSTEDDGRTEALADAPEETYLRLALSAVAPFVVVQEVVLAVAANEQGEFVLFERPRSGVFSPVLLSRLQKIVGCLAARGLRHLDFGDLLEPPAGFDASGYDEGFPGPPVIANYFFFPQPSTTVTARFLARAIPEATSASS